MEIIDYYINIDVLETVFGVLIIITLFVVVTMMVFDYEFN